MAFDISFCLFYSVWISNWSFAFILFSKSVIYSLRPLISDCLLSFWLYKSLIYDLSWSFSSFFSSISFLNFFSSLICFSTFFILMLYTCCYKSQTTSKFSSSYFNSSFWCSLTIMAFSSKCFWAISFNLTWKSFYNYWVLGGGAFYPGLRIGSGSSTVVSVSLSTIWIQF